MGGFCWFHIPLASTTLAAEKMSTWWPWPLHARFVSVLKDLYLGSFAMPTASSSKSLANTWSIGPKISSSAIAISFFTLTNKVEVRAGGRLTVGARFQVSDKQGRFCNARMKELLIFT